MPHVQITWVEGRTPEQKRKIAERVTAVQIEDGKAKRENIHVSFHDVPATNYAEAGVLVLDQKRTPRATMAGEQQRRPVRSSANYGYVPALSGHDGIQLDARASRRIMDQSTK